jgi:hypothetical protein
MPSSCPEWGDSARLAAALALAAALREAGLTPRGYTLRRPDAPVRVTVQDVCRRSRDPGCLAARGAASRAPRCDGHAPARSGWRSARGGLRG